MRASFLILIAIGLLIIGKWAHGKKAVTVSGVAAAVFVWLVIAFLDGGKTQQAALYLAWIILAVAILNPDSPVTAIAGLINRSASAEGKAAKNVAKHGVGGDPGTT